MRKLCFNGAALRGGRIVVRLKTSCSDQRRFNGAALRGGRIACHLPPCHPATLCFNGAALRGGRIGVITCAENAAKDKLQRSRPPRRADRSVCGRARARRWSFNGAALRGGRIDAIKRSRGLIAIRFNGAALRGGRIAYLPPSRSPPQPPASTEPPSEEGG